MQEPQIIRGFLFPPDQQASRAVGPRVGSFHNPTACSAASSLRNRRTLTPLRNVGGVFSTTCSATHRLGIIALIRAEMLNFAFRRTGAVHRNALQSFVDQFLIMHIRAGDGDSDGHAATVRQHGPLDTQLATIRWVFPGFFPHPAVPWSSPRPNFATASRFPCSRRTLPERDARVFRTRRVQPIPENRRGPRCPNRIALASLSTDNQSAERTESRSRRFVMANAGDRPCNFVCKLGAAVRSVPIMNQISGESLTRIRPAQSHLRAS